MKKLLIALTLVFALSGCTRNPTNNTDNNNNNKPNTNETTPNDTNPGTSNPNGSMPNAGNNTSSWYDQFETGLRDNDFSYTAKTSLDPSSIGGAEGYRYMGQNGNVDIYRFDEGEKLDKIRKDKKININGEEKKVEVNGNWVIVSDSLSEDVLNMFRGLNQRNPWTGFFFFL